MHHQPLVRMLRGVRHGAKETQAIYDRQPLLIAVGRDGRSVRASSMTRYADPSGVSPASSRRAMLGWLTRARMWRSAWKRVEPSPTAAIDCTTLSATCCSSCPSRALGPINGAHAAAANQVDDPPRAEAHAEERIGPWRRVVVHQALDAQRPVGRIGRKQCLDLAAQCCIRAAGTVEERRPFAWRQIHRILEHGFEARPPAGVGVIGNRAKDNSQPPTPNSRHDHCRSLGNPWELGVGGWELTCL